jgi:hypothetical protein
MSSAKTIADILVFAELIDVKSFIGNPFTSQPMYIAACAFLAEAAAHASQPPSRSTSPDRAANKQTKIESGNETKVHIDRRQTTKHTLLATAANQNYQRCYKALKMLDSYWAGCRYILTALDQKSKGLMDPLLFTSDDLDGEMPSTELAFTKPGWRRSTSSSASMGVPMGKDSFGAFSALGGSPTGKSWSPKLDHSQAIGWSLTGTTNSPAPNLSFLYQAANGITSGKMSPGSSNQIVQNSSQKWRLHRKVMSTNDISRQMQKICSLDQRPSHQSSSEIMPPPPVRFSTLPTDPVLAADADLLLGLHSPYESNPTQPHISNNSTSYQEPLPPLSSSGAPSSQTFSFAQQNTIPYFGNLQQYQLQHQPMNDQNFGDMLIESQDIDMSDQHGGFMFPVGDMIPWLEYLPQDVLNYFGEPPEDTSGPSGDGQ